MHVTVLTVSLVIAVTSAVDYSAVVDKILDETRAKIPQHIQFTHLHYEQKTWDSDNHRFIVLSQLQGVNGRLELGDFKRDGEPRLSGESNDQMLEAKFVFGLSVKYDNFTADNFTTGEESRGQMTASYDKAEIRTLISINRASESCTSSVYSFVPVTLSDPKVQFNCTSTDVATRLFSEAKYTLNFYLNQTLVTEGLPTFARVVAGPDICSPLY